ncbi:F0F1 ATP synthase subunit epsilon [Nocardioides litoris]|uniref:F0F1 ATP synthase subunit epsilon n=1 Tax=Nocardioides litoris TaxID=1926648 RepID=UPI00111E5517|nr:F0F1 ATP synthase subunit epsilon [Nocardioides litoris]
MAGEGSLQVELVAADRTVWSGEATSVIARTVEGDIGILRGHAPLLSLLTESAVEIDGVDGKIVAALDGGFVSVADDRVSILSGRALLAEEIDENAVRAELGELRTAAELDDDRIRHYEAQLQAVDRAR